MLALSYIETVVHCLYLDHLVKTYVVICRQGQGSPATVFRLFLIAVKRFLPSCCTTQKQTANTAEMGGTINTLRTPTSGDAKSFANRVICQQDMANVRCGEFKTPQGTAPGAVAIHNQSNKLIAKQPTYPLFS